MLTRRLLFRRPVFAVAFVTVLGAVAVFLGNAVGRALVGIYYSVRPDSGTFPDSTPIEAALGILRCAFQGRSFAGIFQTGWLNQFLVYGVLFITSVMLLALAVVARERLAAAAIVAGGLMIVVLAMLGCASILLRPHGGPDNPGIILLGLVLGLAFGVYCVVTTWGAWNDTGT